MYTAGTHYVVRTIVLFMQIRHTTELNKLICKTQFMSTRTLTYIHLCQCPGEWWHGYRESFNMYTEETHVPGPEPLAYMIITRIGVFAQGQILCISPNGLQAGHCDAPPPPFWMTENEFRSHFSPFQSNTQLWFFFHKMAAGGHFGWPIAFLAISDQY